MNKKMKKMLHSKKAKLVLTGAALAAMGLGTTYAWWTASSETSSTVTMGQLSVKADFPGFKDETAVEPGLDAESDGTITNNGTVDSLTKITPDVRIEFAQTADGTAIAEGDRKFEAADPKAVVFSYLPSIDQSSDESFWMQDKDGNLYALIKAGQSLKLHVAENFIGDEMDNHYQGAVIRTVIREDTAQPQDGAVKAQFGVDQTGMDFYDNGIQKRGGADTAGAYKERCMKHFHEIMSR